MSVMDMNSRMAMAEKLSVQQLQQAVQSGSLPAYIGVPLIEQKMKAQKQAAIPQQQAQRPIAQEVMEEASGIASVPSNLPVSGYNDGGIVAFAAGGDVDDDFDYEAYLEQQEESDYDDIIRKYVAEADAAGIEGIPVNRTKKVEQKYAQGGIARLNQGGLGGDFLEPFDTGVELDRARELRAAADEETRRFGTMGATGNPEEFKAAKEAQRRAKESEKLLQGQYELEMANRPEARPATYSDVLRARPTMNGGRNIPPLPSVPYAPPSAALLPTVTVTPDTASPEAPATSGMDYSMNLQDGTGGPVFDPDSQYIAQDRQEGRTPVGRTAPTGNQGTPQGVPSLVGASRSSGSSTGESPRTERPKSAFDDFMADIKASRDELSKQKAQDKYMAIMQAGLGMMSGTSPNAFANIGQGAQMGVASYAASGKQRAAERAALNKNLLMGQRYQSMEDIANRTADINESRYRDSAAARAAGAGDGASLKQERILDQREAALARAIQQGQATVANALKARFGETGMLTNKADYDKAYRELTAEYVAPYIAKRNQLDSQRFPDLFGENAPKSNAPMPSSGFRIVQ